MKIIGRALLVVLVAVLVFQYAGLNAADATYRRATEDDMTDWQSSELFFKG